MRSGVVITGGAGFLGLRLAQHLIHHGLTLPDGHIADPDITLVDRPGTPDPGVSGTRFVVADVTDAREMTKIITSNTAAVYHLAAVVSGQAEAEFELGYTVNVQGAENTLNAARAAGPGVLFVTTSSLAVFGANVPEQVTEATPTQPRSSYGMAKAMVELLCADYSRRGWVDARILRLPTIVIRPGKPNAAASSFASSILREPLNGETAICPVDPSTALWVATPRTAINSMVHVASIPNADLPDFPVINAPGQTIEVKDMIAGLTEDQQALVSYDYDATIDRIVGSWPARFDTTQAKDLGFPAEPHGAAAIIAAYSQTF
ncbi:D-erythronate dehydrogenase [Shimia ponticola]|uniref:D-erythronate dehydrogenase n=1 Tax=Shimia ponticola TaxID=2582893 RepID=UPI0011BE949C|nr:D-erythronate dehydrogenase [Shimia ponticola]